jgi:hypothetical protein
VKRIVTLLAVLAPTCALTLAPVPAQAATTAVSAVDLAFAIAADQTTVTSAEFLNPIGALTDSATSPAVRADTALMGFPRAGSTYAALSNGHAGGFVASQQTGGESFGQDDGPGLHGAYNNDTTVLRVDVDVPAGDNCLSVDLAFGTDEFPTFLEEGLIVEIDQTTWTTPTDSTISAPDDIATGSDGKPLTATTPELVAQSPAGVRDYLLPLSTATAPITPGPHSIFFSIFDEQDHTTNSDALLDNLRFSQVATPAAQCVKGMHPAITNAAAPVVSGSPVVGGTLTSSTGTWTPTGLAFSYQWLRGSAPIPGATAKTYTPVTADLGQQLKVQVTAANGSSLSSTSAPTSAVTQPPVVQPPGAVPETLTSAQPRVTGRAKVGRTLTAVPGAWGPGFVTFAYQWFRGLKAVKGATAATYRLKKKDRGKSLHVVVTGSEPGFVTVTRTSPSTKPVKGG